MKTDTLRSYLAVHTWAGILSSLMLFVAFYAGALTMFEPEITQWVQPPAPARADASQDADALAAAFFAAHPEPPPRATLMLAGPGQAAPHIRYLDRGRRQQVELDLAGTLRPLPGSLEAGDFVDRLHRKGGLPLPLEPSEPIIGVVSLVYALALVSGVVVLLPSLVKDLFVLRIGRNLKRMWLDLHNLLGIASLPFHVVMALSAAVFCLHDWIYAAQNAWIYPQGLKAVSTQATPRRPPTPGAPAQWLPPSQLLARLAHAAPGFQPASLEYRGVGTPKAIVHVAGSDDRHFKRSPRHGYALLDPASGQLIESTYLPGQQASGWAAALVSFFALHFGSYGGEPLRVLYAVLGVLGALLFYTGNVLWIESRTKPLRPASAGPRQPRHVRAVAALNIGLCLGCVAGVSAALVALRWLAHTTLGPDGVLHGSCYAVVLACIGYAGVRGARAATPGLLAAAALATALIPATSLFGALAPSAWAAWAPAVVKPYLAPLWAVDLLSAGAAALLAGLALRARDSQPRAKAPASPVFSTPSTSFSHHD